jgi:hypothetical protein
MPIEVAVAVDKQVVVAVLAVLVVLVSLLFNH